MASSPRNPSIADCPFAVLAVRSPRSGRARRHAIKQRSIGLPSPGMEAAKLSEQSTTPCLSCAWRGRSISWRSSVRRPRTTARMRSSWLNIWQITESKSSPMFSGARPSTNTKHFESWSSLATMIFWSWAATRNRGGRNCSSAGPLGRSLPRRQSPFLFRISQMRVCIRQRYARVRVTGGAWWRCGTRRARQPGGPPQACAVRALPQQEKVWGKVQRFDQGRLLGVGGRTW